MRPSRSRRLMHVRAVGRETPSVRAIPATLRRLPFHGASSSTNFRESIHGVTGGGAGCLRRQGISGEGVATVAIPLNVEIVCHFVRNRNGVNGVLAPPHESAKSGKSCATSCETAMGWTMYSRPL